MSSWFAEAMNPPMEKDELSEGEEDAKPEGDKPPTPPSSCRGVSIEVPSMTIPVPASQLESNQAAQDTPVAALRRYLDNMPHHPSPQTELRSAAVWRGVRSELVASFLLTVVSSAASIHPLANILNRPRTLAASTKDLYISEMDSQDASGFGWGAEWAIGHGLTLGALTWAIRTAHFSLPTTLALFVSRKISVLRASLHASAQIVGSLVATPVLLGLLPRPPRAPSLAPSLSPVQGWGAEFLATVLVSLISLSSYECPVVMTRLNCHQREGLGEDLTPRIAHGALLPLVAAHISAGLFTAGFTGVGLNPARSMALAALTGNWTNHWIWWVGPALGGLLAAFTHEYTGARDPTRPRTNLTDTPRPSIVPRDASRPSFLLSSSPVSPTY